MRNLFILFILFSFGPSAAYAQIATGGDYTLNQSVVATGGGASAGGTFTIAGTAGQFAAGTKQQITAFTFRSGFWSAPDSIGPTAALVNLGGRATDATGRGIRNVRIILAMADGETRHSTTGSFGYYQFADLPAGETYIVTASAKRFVFYNPTQVVTLLDERDDVNFTAND